MTSADDRRGRHGPTDYDAIQREIRDRQARIGDTLDSLRHRLAPGNLKEQTMNRMTNRMSSGASSMGDMVRDHPLPFALIGLGVGWMLLSRSGMDQRIAHSRAVGTVRSGASSTARYARDTFYSAADSARHAAEDMYNRAGDAVGHASDRARGATSRMGSQHDVYRDGRTVPSGSSTRGMGRQMSRVSSGFWDMVDDHPLVAGVMGVALGAALGASIPSTRYEERWVGDYAHQVTDRAKEAAQDAVDRGTRAARAAAESAREHLTEAVEEVQSAAGDAKNAAKEEMKRPS